MKNTNQLIGCCGLDCETCDARIATVTNDDALREKTAAFYPEWIFFQRYLNFSQTKNSIGGHGENLRIFFVFFLLLYTSDFICCLCRGG